MEISDDYINERVYEPVSRPVVLDMYNIRHILNTTLCQFSVSKTKKAIECILTNVSLMAMLSDYESLNSRTTHHLTVIFTNKSLAETEQWKYRLRRELGQMQIVVLSSSKKAKYNKLDTLVGDMLDAKKTEEFPNVIVACTHDKRTIDILNLIKRLNNNRILGDDCEVKRITMTVMFDEADKMAGTIKSFLKGVFSKLNTPDGRNINRTVTDIHYITATPYESLWKMLKECGVNELENLNQELIKVKNKTNSKEDGLTLDELDFTKTITSYRSHHHHLWDTSIPQTHESSPDVYARLALTEIIRSCDTSGPLTIYGPAIRTVKSHIKMYDMVGVVSKKFNIPFHVMIHNGTTKGIYSPDGSFTPLDEYEGNEMKDKLVTWRKTNPEDHLYITGYLTITRGITFNTTGFQFTHMIFSEIHLNNISDAVQMVLRGSGHKRYVSTMVVYSPSFVKKTIDKRVDKMHSILEQDPERLEESSFREQTKKDYVNEILRPASTVPVQIVLSDDEYKSCILCRNRNRNKYNHSRLMELFSINKPELFREVEEYNKDRIREPRGRLYVKHIKPLLTANRNNTLYRIAIDKKDWMTNMYQIWLDYENHNMIISVWHGSRLTSLPEDI